MIHVFRCEQWIEKPLEEVFAFFADASNLERITPPELKFRILTPTPFTIETGTIIDYQLRLAGIPFNWKTEITEWNPPHSFADSQARGPYSLWLHRHTFEFVDGRTKISDEVRYRLPLSPLGDIAYPIVKMQIDRIFAHRRDAVALYFGS
jgi:ligand-binding SRPBCC domain-containing protein